MIVLIDRCGIAALLCEQANRVNKERLLLVDKSFEVIAPGKVGNLSLLSA
jgi:hypothetical protein